MTLNNNKIKKNIIKKIRGILVILHVFNRLYLTESTRRTKTVTIEKHRDATYQFFKNWSKIENLNKP